MTGVSLELRDDVLVATIERPHRRNAVDVTAIEALREALGQDVAAVVIAGSHDDFCAGGDLGELTSSDLEAATRHVERVSRLPAAIEATPRPVVAAVDGWALGTGYEMAAAADAVVATPCARFGVPELPHGFVSMATVGRSPGVIGRGTTRQFVLHAQRWLSGEEAHRLGLVCELHPPELLVDAAVALAADLAAAPGFRSGKRLLARDADATYRLVPVLSSPLLLSDRARAARERFARA